MERVSLTPTQEGATRMSRHTEKQLDILVQLVKTGGQPMSQPNCDCCCHEKLDVAKAVCHACQAHQHGQYLCPLHQAAPALLSALKQALESNISGNDWEKQAKEAIATAEGRG